MELVKLGAAVLNQTPLDWAQNRANILAAIAAARAEAVSVLCLPELCLTGYGCEDAFHSRGLQERAWQTLWEIVPETAGMVVSIGLPVLYGKALFNASALLADRQVLGFVAKRFLAGDGLHYEPRWFKPWPSGQRTTLVKGGARFPLGDLHFDVGGIKIGFEICEDAWVADRPGSELALRGVDVILNPSASHFAFGKLAVRERLVAEGSRAFGVSYVYANLLGNEAGRAIYDGGALIASGGRIVARGPRFSFADLQLTTAVVDVDLGRMSQSRTASYQPHIDPAEDGEGGQCVHAAFSYPPLDPRAPAAASAAWESSPHDKEEEFTRAVALALFDYMRKSRSSGFVVSLSGGADSAAVACLVALSVELGLGELGKAGFLAKLPRSLARVIGPILDGVGAAGGASGAVAADVKAVVGRLLSCVYQATENSSETTLSAARTVAAAVGAEFLALDVDALCKGYVSMIAEAIHRPIDWRTDDIALQNIQARTRAPGVWLLANLRNALLVATSNRSEAAVGYATMDGDTCGGISPIAGIDKAFLRRWLAWLEREGPVGLHPIGALSVVTRQAPTAELRPAAAAQTDEADLMPYDLLDFVERAAIRDRQTPVEIFRLLEPRFPQYAAADLVTWLERFFRLWCRNQWKRERYAPSFHVDDENLDPKTWCRFPILSGGFEEELAELGRYVAARARGAAG